MPRPKGLTHVFVDFDETLFDHALFGRWLEKELDEAGMLPGGLGSFMDSLDDYHEVKSPKPLLRLYKHADHMNSATKRSWDFLSGEIEALVIKRQKDFCYHDAHLLLRWLSQAGVDVRILTYGDGDYQRFKLMTCRYLKQHHIPVHVTNQQKSSFLLQNFKNKVGILIDDKYPMNLPAGWTHIWLDVSSKIEMPEQIDKGTIKVCSLSQAVEYIKLKIDK